METREREVRVEALHGCMHVARRVGGICLFVLVGALFGNS